ncbi:uncharacterized protein LOC129591160 [Paramacrobiotus metropolitanus]|uniref:uncharacterized protein LOC129591160 n=1 Tax=Paramacrobiotus metropolitanus TaxID=2943436 RepID=UPI002445FEC4|nr:uncharacterized protein LOC129591160 [Paramacrobiotus metropolitanus]
MYGCTVFLVVLPFLVVQATPIQEFPEHSADNASSSNVANTSTSNAVHINTRHKRDDITIGDVFDDNYCAPCNEESLCSPTRQEFEKYCRIRREFLARTTPKSRHTEPWTYATFPPWAIGIPF